MHQDKYMYVGTVRNGGSIKGNGEGIFCVFQSKDGTMEVKGLLKGNSLSCLCKGKGNMIYAVSETKDFNGLNGSGGGVVACSIQEDGSLKQISSSVSYGSRPCHLTITHDGRYLLVANHGSHTTVTCSYQKTEDGSYELVRGFDDSSIAMFSLEADGSIGKLCDLVVLKGKGYWCHGGGQSTSHVHCVIEDHGKVIACNRGTDEIVVYTIENDRLKPLSSYHTPNGYAPRNAIMHPSSAVFYVLFENYPVIGVYSLSEDGSVEQMHMIGTMEAAFYQTHPLPVHLRRHADKDEVNTCAMFDHSLPMGSILKITSDGTTLYAANRSYCSSGSISVYRIDCTGMLKLIQVKEVNGGDIRGFEVDEENRCIIVGIMDGGRIVMMPIEEDGTLRDEISSCSIPATSCIVL